MNLLRKFPISKRLWLIPVVAILMLFILGMLMIQQVRSDLYKGKQEMTRHVVETAAGIFDHYRQLETSGAMSTAEAQQAAIKQIRALRYDGQDYFWINDLGPVMIMHPMQPKLEGQNLSQVKDPTGKALFNEMVAVARSNGAGAVDYMWAKPGEADPVPKISYVQLFQPWGWIIGSGIYVDDVEAEFKKLSDAFLHHRPVHRRDHGRTGGYSDPQHHPPAAQLDVGDGQHRQRRGRSDARSGCFRQR